MKELYIILEKSIKSKKITELTDILLDNYKLLFIIKTFKTKINIDKFNINLYSKDDFSESNLLLMYKLVEKNFYHILNKCNFLKLKTSEEVKNNESSGKYITIITDKYLNLKIFKCYLVIYYLNLNLNLKKSYLGLDFEFNTKKVALMQVNFEQIDINLFDTSLIFMFDPKQLSSNWKLFFVQKILCNLNCIKILHGSDSLDIPYLYSDLLYNNTKNIKKFNERFIDTKYLCEYKYYSNNQSLGKCKIYHVLKSYDIISEDKINELMENERNMGPIYDIIINVNKMSTPLIKYTLYDVLYLFHLVHFFEKNIEDMDAINQMTQYIFMEKRQVTNLIPYEEINKMNNYLIINNKNVIRLNDVFKKTFNNFILKNKKLNNFLKINYFKNTLINLFKFISYQEICKKSNVYSKISKNKILYDKEILNFNIIIPDSLTNIINSYKNYIPFVYKL